MKVMKKKAAMKAMKVMKKKAAMKAMKVMKKKSVSKIARGTMAKVMVLRGSKGKTVGGLTAKDLIKNKHGRVVSKKQGAQGPEDHGLYYHQEGHTTVRQSQGVLQPVSAA